MKVVDENGAVWFVAKDVADALGYKDHKTALRSHCKGEHHLLPLQTAGGIHKTRIIDEPNVYRLIFGSELESAKRFQDWVFEDVLPTIRKTGKYEAPKVEPKPESSLIERIKTTSEIVDATMVLDDLIQACCSTADTQNWIPLNPLSGNTPSLVG